MTMATKTTLQLGIEVSGNLIIGEEYPFMTLTVGWSEVASQLTLEWLINSWNLIGCRVLILTRVGTR